MTIKIVSLFSGIGMQEQAMRNLTDFELVNYCENNKKVSACDDEIRKLVKDVSKKESNLPVEILLVREYVRHQKELVTLSLGKLEKLCDISCARYVSLLKPTLIITGSHMRNTHLSSKKAKHQKLQKKT